MQYHDFHIHFINEQYGGMWYNGLQFPSCSLYLSKAALLYCQNGICLLWAWQVMLSLATFCKQQNPLEHKNTTSNLMEHLMHQPINVKLVEKNNEGSAAGETACALAEQTLRERR